LAPDKEEILKANEFLVWVVLEFADRWSYESSAIIIHIKQSPEFMHEYAMDYFSDLESSGML